MNKNIIFLLIDSLNYSHVKNSNNNLMPFFNELKKNSIICDNMYSQAPYTEAALMNIICGQNVLNNGGYLYRFKNAKTTIFEEVKKRGYHVFTNSYEPQCHPSSVLRGLDDWRYFVGFDPKALWTYRISHFADLYYKKNISEHDFNVIEEILEDNFESWMQWVDRYINNDITVEFIKNNSSTYDAQAVKIQLDKEYNLYLSDKKQYLYNMFKKGLSHEFFTIPAFKQDYKIKEKTTRININKKFSPLLKKIRFMNIKYNIINQNNILSGPLKKFVHFISKPSKVSWKNFLKASYLSVNTIFDLDLFDRISFECDTFKDGPSCRSMIDYFFKWKKEYSSPKPYFAFIHVNDVHNPEIFFTYDSDSSSLLESEYNTSANLLDSFNRNFKGNVTHDLSLRYIDSQIEYLFKNLQINNMLDETIVIICADHGFSFSGNPLRDSFVINLYLENYNIPFLIYGHDLAPMRIDSLTSSKDIPATICDLIDGHIPSSFSGQSIFNKLHDEILVIEYCGGGCPDIFRRELKMAAFDKNYFVGTLGTINSITTDTITEVYNLMDDPLQMNNLAKKYKNSTLLTKYIEVIDKRKKEIIKTYRDI